MTRRWRSRRRGGKGGNRRTVAFDHVTGYTTSLRPTDMEGRASASAQVPTQRAVTAVSAWAFPPASGASVGADFAWTRRQRSGCRARVRREPLKPRHWRHAARLPAVATRWHLSRGRDAFACPRLRHPTCVVSASPGWWRRHGFEGHPDAHVAVKYQSPKS